MALTRTWDGISVLLGELCELSEIDAPVLQAERLRILCDRDLAVRGPFLSDHGSFLMQIADAEVSPADELHRERLFGFLNTQIRRYNDLIIGVPEVFVAFCTPDLRTEQLVTKVVGIPPVHMERWRRIWRRMPEDDEGWIDDWSHQQLPEIAGVVERPYRAPLAAFGRALHRISGGYRIDKDSGEHALYDRAVTVLCATPVPGGAGQMINDLTRADPERWIPRFPALVDQLTGKSS